MNDEELYQFVDKLDKVWCDVSDGVHSWYCGTILMFGFACMKGLMNMFGFEMVNTIQHMSTAMGWLCGGWVLVFLINNLFSRQTKCLGVNQSLARWIYKLEVIDIKCEQYRMTYGYHIENLERVGAVVFKQGDWDQWYQYIMNTLRRNSKYNGLVRRSKKKNIVEKHIQFFERNKEKLSVFDYEYYYVNQKNGCKYNQKNVKLMMEAIDNQRVNEELNVEDKCISYEDLESEIAWIRESRLDEKMRVLLA